MSRSYNVGTRRLFVDAAAWFVIVCSAAWVAAVASDGALSPSALRGLLEVGLLWFAGGPLHAAAAWLQTHPAHAGAATAAMSALAIATAAGLLRRFEWARRGFVALTALTLVALVATFGVQHDVVGLVIHHAVHGAELSAAALVLIDQLTGAARALAYGLSIAAGAALLALLRALLSHEVRQEFA